MLEPSQGLEFRKTFIAGVDLEGPEEYLTYLVFDDTQQSTGGKWDVWPNNEPTCSPTSLKAKGWNETSNN